MTIEEFKAKIKLLKEVLNNSKQNLLGHLAIEPTLEGEEAIKSFDEKTLQLTNEIKAL